VQNLRSMNTRINKTQTNVKNNLKTNAQNETIRGTTRLLLRVARMRIKSRYATFMTWYNKNCSLKWFHWVGITAVFILILNTEFGYMFLPRKNKDTIVYDSSALAVKTDYKEPEDVAKKNYKTEVPKKTEKPKKAEKPKNGTGEDSEFAPADPDQLDKLTAEEYIKKYKNIAIQEMRKHKIPASITLAQAIIESRSGDSRLARDLNNHFGIKCHSRTCCKGHCKNYTDDHHKDFFRSFKTVEESYKAHSLVVLQDRYVSRVKNRKDYRSWAKALQDGGYATGKQYASKLIRVIERYKLNKYDR
jgi:flagellum-specific peptidoglycan hydrolase FlgJ